jgi:cytochrome c biogenesis protein ResB
MKLTKKQAATLFSFVLNKQFDISRQGYILVHLKLLSFWTSSLLRNSNYYKTQRFENWTPVNEINFLADPTEKVSPSSHLKMETEPVYDTLCFLDI